MFNRTAPSALAIAFLLIIATLSGMVLASGVWGTAPAGHDGIPAAYTYQYGPGHTFNSAPTIDTADWGTDIPRCASDDWNSTGLPRCYVESPVSIIIIDADDHTLATLSK